MADTFLHGVEVIEIDSGARPIQTASTSVIGIIGTAPGAQPELKATASVGTAAANNGVGFTSKLAGALGNAIALTILKPTGNNVPLSIAVNGLEIAVTLATGAANALATTGAQLITAINAHAGASALVTAAALGASTGAGMVPAQARTLLAGGANEAFPLDTPVLIAGSRAEAAKLGTTGTLPNALDSILDQAGAVVVVVRVAAGADDAATIVNVVGGVDGPTGAYKGVQAFLGAESALGFAPRILLAPGFTHQRNSGAANAVVAELLGIAQRLRAVIIADGPNTNDADAIAAAGDFGSPRVFLADPWVLKLDPVTGENKAFPASPCVAGLIARSDNERGFWWSPSNQEINGIVGTARKVDFVLGDSASRANLLNASKVATIIRQNGFRLWGNRSLSADPKWQFLCVRRTADIINDSLQRAHLWAVDRGITKTYLADVTDGVNAYLRHLVAIGAILGGKCWANPDLNTPDQIAQGKVYIDFDFTPPYPAEHITFRSHLTDDYLSEVL